jgi:hypothetical protein
VNDMDTAGCPLHSLHFLQYTLRDVDPNTAHTENDRHTKTRRSATLTEAVTQSK